MKSVESYIVALLRRHECVVVPEFGGFLLRETGAFIEGVPQEILPPGKRVRFNKNLLNNDGLLIHYVSSSEGISYADSQSKVQSAVNYWNLKLGSGAALQLFGLGRLWKEGDRLLFIPEKGQNFHIPTFGLPILTLTPLLEELAHSEPQAEIVIALPEAREHGYAPGRIFWRVASAAAVIAFLAGGAWMYQRAANEVVAKLSAEKKPLQSEVSVKATGQVAANATSAPAHQETAHKFYVIGGSFKSEANAMKMAQELSTAGFVPEILQNTDGLFRVSYLKEQDSLTADQKLQTIKPDNQSAWILRW